MKKYLKTVGIILGVLMLLLGIGIGFLMYEFYYKKTQILEDNCA